MIDGETVRARLRAPEVQERLEDMAWCTSHGGIKDFYTRANILHMELPPELFLNPTNHPDLKADIWSLGASVMEILFEKKLWNDTNLCEKVGSAGTDSAPVNTFEILRLAMERRLRPCLADTLDQASPKLRFLSDCFSYNAPDRPSVALLLRSVQQFQVELQTKVHTKNGNHTLFGTSPG